MSVLNYSALYDSLPFPTLVCSMSNQTVLYANLEAKLLLERTLESGIPLRSALGCRDLPEFNALMQSIASPESAQFSRMTIETGQERRLSVLTVGNILDISDEALPAVIYLYDDTRAQGTDQPTRTVSHIQEFLFTIIHNLYHSTDVDAVVNGTLYMIGNFLEVDRVYIFEMQGSVYVNTYEWCSAGTVSQMETLQDSDLDIPSLDKVASELLICGDISKLEERHQKILEPQGVKAIITLPLLEGGRVIGFIGCDECKNTRVWSQEEVQLLQIIAGVVARILLHKLAVINAQEYQKIMQMVLDTIESLIYVSDFETCEILFANETVRKMSALTLPAGEKVEGKICWKTLQKDQSGPCSFCPMRTPFQPNGALVEPRKWEFKNTTNDRWYLVRDWPIRWLDGRYVHMEVATDITDLKEKEEKLREFASIDRMTGIYNREWGYMLLQENMAHVKSCEAEACLCFFDLDGLKKVNDTYGHSEGDIMITAFVSSIKSFTRGADIFCRWGGDEFILLLTDCTLANAEKIVRKIEENLKMINEERIHPYNIAFSYGVKRIRYGMKEGIDEVISIADERMYINKTKKMGGFKFHE